MVSRTEVDVNTHLKGSTIDRNRASKFFLILISISSLLLYSKFGIEPPVRTKIPATTTVSYSSKPGGNYSKINIRSGPGIEHSVIKEISRGDLVFGLGHELDANGERWIKLRDGGYAKETVLTKIENQ